MSTPSLQTALKYDFSLPEEKNRDKVHRDRPDVDNVTITPSQAEGDRETIERDLGDPETTTSAVQGGGQGERQPMPSQAEGDRETVERDLRETNSGGHE